MDEQLKHWRAHPYAKQVQHARDPTIQLIAEDNIQKLYSRYDILEAQFRITTEYATLTKFYCDKKKKLNEELQSIERQLHKEEFDGVEFWEDNFGYVGLQNLDNIME
ncbi:hypothetical protein Fot_04640 [Forsythia ovata]|uniref:Uncharacterized protein n=1 Tax=Forsythia ovata TaxID=205694 RepID=A0ABD1XD50_9LAMI